MHWGQGQGKGAANGHEDIGGNGNDERQRERHLLFTLIISSKFENIYIGIPSSERDVDIYTCLTLSLSRNPLLRQLLLPPLLCLLLLLRLLGNCKLSCYSPASLSLSLFLSVLLSGWGHVRKNKFILIHKINTLLASGINSCVDILLEA